jgi:predicted MFS family arabinose efflux permease
MSPPQAASITAPRKAALLVAAMWVAYFLNYSDRQAVFALFPVLKSDLGFTDAQLGLIGAVFLWVYAIGCPIAGQVGDRISKRLLVVLSLAVWSSITLLTGLSTSVVMMLGLRACMGISESLYMPAAIALTANAHPPAQRSRAIAALTTAQVVGIVAGGWFGGWMGDLGHWRWAFFFLGAVGLCYAVPYTLFLRTVPEEKAIRTRAHGAGFVAVGLFRTPTFVLLCVIFPVFVFGLWIIYGWLPDFLHGKFPLNLADAAFNATMFVQGSALVGLLGGGILADWLYRRTRAARLWLMAASLLICAPCLHLLGHSATLDGTRAAAVAFGLSAGFLQGNIFPAAFEIVPADARASAVGILNFFGALVSGFATLFGGLWKKTIGIEGLMTRTAVLYLVAGIVLIVGIKCLFKRDFARVAEQS